MPENLDSARIVYTLGLWVPGPLEGIWKLGLWTFGLGKIGRLDSDLFDPKN